MSGIEPWTHGTAHPTAVGVRISSPYAAGRPEVEIDVDLPLPKTSA